MAAAWKTISTSKKKPDFKSYIITHTVAYEIDNRIIKSVYIMSAPRLKVGMLHSSIWVPIRNQIMASDNADCE